MECVSCVSFGSLFSIFSFQFFFLGEHVCYVWFSFSFLAKRMQLSTPYCGETNTFSLSLAKIANAKMSETNGRHTKRDMGKIPNGCAILTFPISLTLINYYTYIMYEANTHFSPPFIISLTGENIDSLQSYL